MNGSNEHSTQQYECKHCRTQDSQEGVRKPIITGRNEVLAKVICLHLSVILFTGGGCLLPGGCLLQILGGCSKFSGGMSAPNFRGGVCSKFSGGWGVSAPNFRGWGGVCSKFGGCLLQIFRGVSAPNFGGGLLQIFGGGFLQFLEYGHRSAGTYSTGMHSCLA